MRPKALRSFAVRASLPEALAPLQEIAMNLRWSWDSRSKDLFRWADHESWEMSGHNPVKMLGMIGHERLEAIAADPGFMEFMAEIHDEIRRYNENARWFQRRESSLESVAYFSPEFGLTEALPQYSGGLGVLAGDHLKAASGLGVPIVGVGLFYRQGYFRQELNADGWQQEHYVTLDPFTMAITPVEGLIEVDLAGQPLYARLWKAQVGRVPLYLMDSDIDENESHHRSVTDRLYSGGEEHRLQQEILLGMGGVRALDHVGISPQVFHMNEGHAGFLALERIRVLIKGSGLTLSEAIEAVRSSTAFTTHTPVPAGIDIFSRELMERYFKKWADDSDIEFEDLMALGRATPEDMESPFNMALMCLRLSGKANGVSKLHSRVSKRMFQNVWPSVPMDEIPIGWVTNGVHSRTWVAPSVAELFDRYVLPEWNEAGPERWAKIESARDDEIWRIREHNREQLVLFVRRKLREAAESKGAGDTDLAWYEHVFDSKVLTIGFARRFAEYKRPTLLFSQPERLRSLLLSPERPIQLVFAGKAHPADERGKEMIRQIVQFSKDPLVRNRIAFIEDYDIAVARALYQGVDIWLNNPIRPLEACGTSGEKAALNGALNLSILDGWWDEMYDGENGWAIASAEAYTDPIRRNEAEAVSLFDLLESQILPRFYDRLEGPVPRLWVSKIKRSLASLGPQVSASRMVRDYVGEIYEPLAERSETLRAESFLRAKELAEWKTDVVTGWEGVVIHSVDSDSSVANLGTSRRVHAVIGLGGLRRKDVEVQLIHGPVASSDELYNTQVTKMSLEGAEGDGGSFRYEGSFKCDVAGRYGFAVRVVPSHEFLPSYVEVGAVTWA
ncbi:MAG TPA: alpha-glucan family phosphorylase [Actinomycetota bacterium]|nr:alpha-glucan family phosphorylase [Actinomycetota bacterium]